ncbi:MAG TPA: HPr family phosphocarrier protein [Gemmatimonadaceae bacterium]|nr:HPr family phosphocarrier protein [Gemmatimonadaceae bacterium]
MTLERAIRIVNENGIHARPAAEIVKVASRFRSEITLSRDGLEVNGKSIMGVMMLAAECGSTVVAKATGEDAEQALDALERVISSKFGES